MQRLLTHVLDLVSLLKDFAFVDTATLLGVRAVLVDVQADDIVLVEWLGPALGDLVLHLILDDLFVWTLG